MSTTTKSKLRQLTGKDVDKAFKAIIDNKSISGTLIKERGNYILAFNGKENLFWDITYTEDSTPGAKSWDYEYCIKLYKGGIPRQKIVNITSLSIYGKKLSKPPYNPFKYGIAGERVKFEDGRYKFGCGDVAMTKAELVDIIPITEILQKSKSTNTIIELLNKISRFVSLDMIDIEEAKALLTAKIPRKK